MSGEEDLYLNQSEADALFFSDALLGNADELDFESFGHATGLDDGTFNGITGPGLTSFEARDVFKLNSGSFVDEIEAKCEITHPTELAANNLHSFSNGTSSSDGTFVFNKPTLDLEGMGMAYGVSGLYLQGNMSPSAEKMNGLTLGQMPGYSTYETKQFMSAPPPVASAAPPVATKGMSRFGSQEILMAAAENGALQEAATTSPVLSPSSSDGKGGRRQDSGTDFDDQVDGDGDGLQPLPQMRRSSMQRSFSSHALGQLRHMGPATHSVSEMRQSQQVERGAAGGGGLTSPGARLQQPSLAEFQNVGMRPMSVGMRRVYSAGDIQTLNGMQGGLGGGASPSFDDGNYRVGKYSMEERKIRIHRYQQKRTQRNFNKKIKYACRKTLADSRPRVRGRFAKNMDDDIPVAVLGRKREDDDDDEGDAHVGERANGFHFDNSSGDYSDVLTSIKVEHQRVNSM